MRLGSLLSWCWVLRLLVLKKSPASAAGTRRRETFSHHAVLDENGKYHLRWKLENTVITFEVEVETRGYVGLGLSPTGSMAQSDMVIGGVANGRPYLKDYNTLNFEGKLNEDHHQDYRLEYGMENKTHTIIAFSRYLNSCDNKDKIITDNTVRVIWAYHPKDVQHDHPQYHSSNRGRKSLHLLNPVVDTSIASDVLVFEIRHYNVTIPKKDTTYWCQIFKLPDLTKKHHVIRGFAYPSNVGLSLGTSTDPVYVMMEIHYDNVNSQEGYVDSSGLKLLYTPVLRKYDAGVIETGVWVSLYHMIPPNMPSYTSQGHCTMECLEEALSQEKASGIHVFAALLHSHLAGRVLRIRHFRNDVEQPLLAHDDEFDFNFQEFRYLKEERVLQPGDSLVTECQYNTTSRSNMTWGGLSTRDEMCLSYLLYYPKIDLSRCESLPEILPQLEFIGVREIIQPIKTWPFIIKSPKKYKDLSFTEAMNKFQWSRKKGREFNSLVHRIEMNVRCAKHNEEEWHVHGIPVSPPSLNPWEPKAEVEPVTCRTAWQYSDPLPVLFSLILHIVLATGI
ncbi:DBH-like monooxygenase protein 1 homolog isoform X2 [Chiloscyllium plagiosum]|uniref:DBH-like monooxygenase protein 1 homolog isoform X2 n=1 Tax=Chiloscyllium plagiosum TaxID=36176 RepID=UPI001CB82892|nr:DBH-like monooxygenase protein 1 homolog isoform X2 [Chiloscyllium plagiosum]